MMAFRSSPSHLVRAPNDRGPALSLEVSPGFILIAWIGTTFGALLSFELIGYRGATSRRGSFLRFALFVLAFGLTVAWSSQWVENAALSVQLPESTDRSNQSLTQPLSHHIWAIATCPLVAVLLTSCGFFCIRSRFSGKSSVRYHLDVGLAILVLSGAIILPYYIATFGVIEFDSSFSSRLTGSGIILVVLSIGIALAGFFWLEGSLRVTTMWKMLCSLELSLGVTSGRLLMIMGTEIRTAAFDGKNTRPDMISFSIGVSMFGFTAISYIIILYLESNRKRALEDQVQHVGIASVIFDKVGRVLVDRDGCLPYVRITRSDVSQMVLQKLTVDSSLFQSLWRMTRDWTQIADGIVGMKSRVEASPFCAREDAHQASAGDALVGWDQLCESLFKQAFCVAADVLGYNLGLDLPEIGTLHGQLFNVGTVLKKRDVHNVELEAIHSVGTGRMMLLVRQAHSIKINQILTARGYTFHELDQVVHCIAKRISVPESDVKTLLQDLRASTSQPRPFLPNSTHLGAFVLRSNISSNCMEVLVPKLSSTYLPMVQLDHLTLAGEDLRRLYPLNGHSLASVQWVLSTTLYSSEDSQERKFAEKFLRALRELLKLVNEPWMQDSRFCFKVFKVPIYDVGAARSAAQSRYATPVAAHAYLLAFTFITDIHDSILKHSGDWLAYSPLTTFANQQRVLQNPYGEMAFRREAQAELSQVWTAERSISRLSSRPMSPIRSDSTCGIDGHAETAAQAETAQVDSPSQLPPLSTRSRSKGGSRGFTYHVRAMSAEDLPVFVDELVQVAHETFQAGRRSALVVR